VTRSQAQQMGRMQLRGGDDEGKRMVFQIGNWAKYTIENVIRFCFQTCTPTLFFTTTTTTIHPYDSL
jgi:hypothetical protein